MDRIPTEHNLSTDGNESVDYTVTWYPLARLQSNSKFEKMDVDLPHRKDEPS